MDPFFSRFLQAVKYILRSARCASVPRIWCSSVKSTRISATLHPGKRNQLAWSSSVRQQHLHHHFSSISCDLFVHKRHFSPNLHLDSVFNVDTREGVNSHMSDSYSFLKVMSARIFDISFQKNSKNFIRHLASAVLELKGTIVLLRHAYCHRGGSCKHLLFYPVLLLSTDSILLNSCQR